MARSDGYLAVLGRAFEPTNEYEWPEFTIPGMRTGGYYTGYNGFGAVQVAADLDTDGVDDVLVSDSRGVFLWLNPAEASWIEPPVVVWSRSSTRYPVLLQWDSDDAPELVVAYGGNFQVLDFDGGDAPRSVWSTPIDGSVHLDPLPADVDGDGDLDLFVGMSKSGGIGAHNVLRHEDGAKIWAQDYEEVLVLELDNWTTTEPKYDATLSWNGLDAGGDSVPAGKYTIHATARDIQDREASSEAEVEVSYGSPDGGPDGGIEAADPGCGCGTRGEPGRSWVTLLFGLVLVALLRKRESR